jgi:hypothetical protein
MICSIQEDRRSAPTWVNRKERVGTAAWMIIDHSCGLMRKEILQTDTKFYGKSVRVGVSECDNLSP